MKKSLISMLSLMTAFGTIAPTLAIPSAQAQARYHNANDSDVAYAIQDLMSAVQTMRQTVRAYSRVPGANQRLNGKMEILENSVANLMGTSDRRGGNRDILMKLSDLKMTFLDTATEFGLSSVALIPNVQAIWYQIPMKIGALEQALMSTPRYPQPDPRYPDPRDPPNPRPAPMMSYEFRGSIESNPVYFQGMTPAEFKSNCVAYVQSSRIQYVDQMSNGSGKSIANTSSYMNSDQICAVALLNATNPGYETYGTTEMTIEGVHVAISNALSDAQVAELVATSGFNFQYVDSITVRGQNYGLSNYLSASGQKAIIRYNISRQAPVMKVGSIEQIPFAFSGYSANEIQTQCLDFWSQVSPQYVDSITVNGRTYSTSQYQNAQQACMTIMAAQ